MVDPNNQNSDNKPVTKNIDLFGKQFELPQEIADELIPLRDAYKADKRGDLDIRLAEIENKIKADTEAKMKAQFDKQLEEHKSNNNVDEIKRMLEERHSAQLKEIATERDGLKSKLIDGSIKDAIRSVENIIPDVVDDAILIYKSQFDIAPDGTVSTKDGSTIFGENGEKAKVSDHVKKFLSSKKQFLKADINRGTGAGDVSVDAGEGKVNMSRSEYENKVAAGGPKARKLAKDVSEGKVVLSNA